MIRLEMNPQSKAESVVQWDIDWAFDASKDLSEFVSNSGIEARTAILAILSWMCDRINHLTLERMTKKKVKEVKKVLVKIACQEVDVDMLDQFRQEMGREVGNVN